MSIYIRYSDKTKCIYFAIKDEEIYDKYLSIWKKGSNITKKITVNPYKIKKYLKAEKKTEYNRKLSMSLYTSNIVWFSL